MKRNDKENKQAVDKNHPCYGCIHFYGIYYVNYCCNYIFDIGKPRPCLPGTDCKVKDTDPVQGRLNRKYRKELH